MDQNEFDNLVATLKQKAENGDVRSIKDLGDLYYQGISGKEKNVLAAFPYWKRAVDNGEKSIAYKVGMALSTGDSGIKSDSEALRYFLIAADTGETPAQYMVGMYYESGVGCTSNTAMAKQYYRKAALSGHGQAQYRLGRLQLMTQDEEYFHWLCCAHISGVKEATEILNDMIAHDQTGNGLEVVQKEIDRIKQNGIAPADTGTNNSGGCYIATCIYGSYDCPQVWTLRRFRDNTLAKTWYGRLFVHVYYSISPTLVRWFGRTSWFKRLWRGKLDRLVATLQSRGVDATPYSDKHW